LNNSKQIATFIGTESYRDDKNQETTIISRQTLFHVQHSVGGEEDKPLNVWRIVHLTEGKNEKLMTELFKKVDHTKLPLFVEIYIEKELEIPLTHH
jgi:hypothetical protein